MRAKDWPANRAVASYRQVSGGTWECTLTLSDGQTFTEEGKDSFSAFVRAERLMKSKYPNKEAR